MKRLFLIFLGVFLFSVISFAQIDLGMPISVGKGGVATTIVKDYEALGINPANLGFENNKSFAIGFLNFGFNAQSKALSLNRLSNAIFSPSDKFSTNLKQEFSTLFATADGLNTQTYINWFGTSVHLGRFGGLAINLRDRASAHLSANANFSDVLFNGSNAKLFTDPNNYTKTIGNLFNGTKLQYLHYRELNIGYGVKIIDLGDEKSSHTLTLYGGIGYKFLWGFGYVDVNSNNGNLTAISSIQESSFDINQNEINNYKLNNTLGLFNSAGTGGAWDFGFSALIDRKFKIGLSFTDLGSIIWTKNVVTASDKKLSHLDSTQTGLNSFDIKGQAGYLFNNDGLLSFSPTSSFKTSLPAKFRMGAGLVISSKLEIGADMMVPLNEVSGNLSNAYYALGGEINIFGTVKISTGIAGNKSYGFNIPFGLTLGTIGITEVYIATNDVLTYFDKSKNPMLSFAVGVLRINI